MQAGTLFDTSPRSVRDTSLEAWEALLPTLASKERAVLLALCDYVETTKHPDATGGELAAAMQWPITSVRPRICSLRDKGLVLEHAIRPSRAKFEKRCHPVSPVLSWAAVARAKR